MTPRSFLLLACLLAAGTLAAAQHAPAPAPAAPQTPATAAQALPQPPFVRAIQQVRGDLYKVQSGPGVGAVTLFLVTPDGIILADPLSPEFASWLKGELASRFPGRPVKYVLQSHYHWDHARGGGVFADTARVVAHENLPKNLALPLGQARPPGDTDDLDRDGRLSRDEAQTGTRANFDAFDRNRDGYLTAAEINADIQRPDVTFSDRYTVTLGGKRAVLIHAGNRHTDDLFDVYFPDERVLFAGDYVWVKRLCCGFGFDRRPLADWIASVRALESLDFDLLVTSHWESGTKADLTGVRRYLEDLRDAVSAGIAAGRPVDELQRTVRLPQYQDWAGYDQLPTIVRSAYVSLRQYSR